MLVPLIFTLNSTVDDYNSLLYPAIKSDSDVILERGEMADDVIFNVDLAQSMELADGKLETSFWVDGVPAGSWKVHVTPERLIVHNLYSKGILGGVKIKKGRACAGHVLYKCLMAVNAQMLKGNPALAFYVQRGGGVRSIIAISSPNESVMRDILTTVHARVDTWIDKHERGIARDQASEEKYAELLKDWETLPELAWRQQDEVVSAMVPSKEFDLVPSSRRQY